MVVTIVATKTLKCSRYVNKIAMMHILVLCASRENTSLVKFVIR